MCILAFKPLGSKLPTDEALIAMSKANAHWGGFAYWKRGDKKVTINKGFMSWADAMINAMKRVGIYDNPKDYEVLIHFRWATMGGKNAWNTHPYVLTDKVSQIRTTCGEVELGVMGHNGMFTAPPQKEDDKDLDFSDTALMVRHIFSQVPQEEIMDEEFKKYVEGKISWNKLVFLFPNGDYSIYNEKGWTWDNGVWYSNKTFEYQMGEGKKTSYNYDDDDLDDYYRGTSQCECCEAYTNNRVRLDDWDHALWVCQDCKRQYYKL